MPIYAILGNWTDQGTRDFGGAGLDHGRVRLPQRGGGTRRRDCGDAGVAGGRGRERRSKTMRAFDADQTMDMYVDGPFSRPLPVVTVGRTYLEVVMRMMLKAIVDTDAGNEVFRRGGVVEAVDRIQHVLQPEAFYEFVENGQRTVFAVFDMADPSQIPVITEPLFNLAKAKITLTPGMTLEDIKKGVEEATRRMSSMEG